MQSRILIKAFHMPRLATTLGGRGPCAHFIDAETEVSHLPKAALGWSPSVNLCFWIQSGRSWGWGSTWPPGAWAQRRPQAAPVSLRSRLVRLSQGGPGLMPKALLASESTAEVGEVYVRYLGIVFLLWGALEDQ